MRTALRWLGLCLGTQALLLTPRARQPVPKPARRAPLIHASAGDQPAGDETFSQDLYAELRRLGVDVGGEAPVDDVSEFTGELYAHLEKRPEYQTSEFYKGIKARTDVEDPMMDELDRRREILANTSQPSPSQGPNEVIETVLRALQDVDYPYEGHGIEVLMNYTGPGSSISPAQSKVTPEMLLKYFESSKYKILLAWRNIQYLRKLDVSLDKKRAFQPVKLKSLDGAWVPVTFQLSKYETVAGDVWLIDQFLVKTAARRGEDSSPSLFDD